jgi:hypothetical protein
MGLFTLKKLNIGLFQRAELTFMRFISVSSRGPTPDFPDLSFNIVSFVENFCPKNVYEFGAKDSD